MPFKKMYFLCGALLGSVGLIFQFYLILNNINQSIGFTIVNYFSYFTILTNLLITVFHFSMLFEKSKPAIWFNQPGKKTALTLYIVIVGFIYQVILRWMWSPQGLAMITDEILHSITPLYFLIGWLLLFEKTKLKWSVLFPWLIYPLCYLIYTIIRGSLVNWYPYPFINVSEIGYSQTFINSAGVTLVFVLFGLLFILTDNKIAKQRGMKIGKKTGIL